MIGRTMAWLLILLSLLSAPARAQNVWWDNDGRAPNDPSRAARDGFGAMMLTTSDLEGFERVWAGPTPPNLPVTDEARRGQPVHGMIIFFGCAAGADGNCNVTADLIFLRPNGSTYGEALQNEIWRGLPAPSPNLQLGVNAAGLIVEPNDPMGTWTIRAIVTDNVRRVTVRIEQQVRVETPPSESAS